MPTTKKIKSTEESTVSEAASKKLAVKKAAPRATAVKKTVAKIKKTTEPVIEPVKAGPVEGSVEWLRAAFAAYEPQLVQLQPFTTHLGSQVYPYSFDFDGTVENVNAVNDPRFTHSGMDYYKVPYCSILDAQTFVATKGCSKFEVMPLWFQIEHGYHPTLPQVKDFATFILDWAIEVATKTDRSVYCGSNIPGVKKFRFCEVEEPAYNLPPEIQRYLGIFTDQTLYHEISRYAKVLTVLQGRPDSGQCIDPLKVPQVSPEEQVTLVKKAQQASYMYMREYPSLLEFEDNTAMLEKVKEHCKSIPGFEVHYLRKMLVAHSIGDGMKAHPTAMNANQGLALYYKQLPDNPEEGLVFSKKPIPGYTMVATKTSPVLYAGPAWAVSFSMFGTYACQSNLIYFAEWETFKKQFERYNPELLEGVPKFTDLVFIGSHWCERNTARGYVSGIHEQQDPISRQLSLKNWILGPFMSRLVTTSKLEGVASHSGAVTMKRLEIVERVNAETAKATTVKPKLTPIWAKHKELQTKQEKEAREAAKKTAEAKQLTEEKAAALAISTALAVEAGEEIAGVL